MHGKVQSMEQKLTEEDATAPSVDERCRYRTKCCQKVLLPHRKLREGATTAQEVEGRCRQNTKSCRKVSSTHRKRLKVPKILSTHLKLTNSPVHARNVDRRSHGCMES